MIATWEEVDSLKVCTNKKDTIDFMEISFEKPKTVHPLGCVDEGGTAISNWFRASNVSTAPGAHLTDTFVLFDQTLKEASALPRPLAFFVFVIDIHDEEAESQTTRMTTPHRVIDTL